MKPCPCGATPIVNRSLRSGSDVWCPECKTTLTKGNYSFFNENEPVLEWVHGLSALPPVCPFCKLPPHVEDPESEEPKVSCQIVVCPLEGKTFTLKQWNYARPDARVFERLRERWAKNPELLRARQALERAIKKHKKGRWP